MVYTSPLHVELRSIQDELLNITGTVSRIQNRLSNVQRLTDEEGQRWQTQAAELEAHHAEFAKRETRLNEQNAELTRQLSQGKPDLDKAIEARNDAFRKLRHARIVIRDLVNERVTSHSPGQTYQEGDLRKAIKEALQPRRNSSDSDQAVSLLTTPRAGPSNARESSVVNAVETQDKEKKSLSPPVAAVPTAGSGGSRHASVSINAEEDEVWKIHYSKPPATTRISCGPISLSRLIDKAIVADEEAESLSKFVANILLQTHTLRLEHKKSLQHPSDFGLALQIIDDVAFLHDPIFLEGPQSTHILDWAPKSVNQQVSDYIKEGRGDSATFHTFVYPVKLKNWYYVGAHTWKIVDLWQVWLTFGEKSKQRLVGKLRERCNGQYDVGEIEDMLKKRQLRQFCVEISSAGHDDQAKMFARRMGYTPRRQTSSQ